jgi:GNAT superfamily N-acetyltransferase
MARVSVRVRPAQLEDVDGLVALIRSSDFASGLITGSVRVDSAKPHLSERLTEMVCGGGRSLLVAVDDLSGEIVGVLVAKPDELGGVDLTPVLHVTHLLVSPRHRRRGVGRSLLAAAVHLAEEHGMDRVLATASSGSREANRYLARLGFVPLVIDRLASTAVLRRSLRMAEGPDRIAALRRARLMRGPRTPAFRPRTARRGA